MKHVGPGTANSSDTVQAQVRRYNVLGVGVQDMTMADAICLCGTQLTNPKQTASVIYFVNAHTLNLAAADTEYARSLNGADYIFGDGTGVRWATRIIHGHRLLDNVNGTDMTPALFDAYSGLGLRYFLLGATPQVIERAASYARSKFVGWTLAGWHHGYIDDEASKGAVQTINAARPDLLLVGMGNPLQEEWISRHRDSLQVSLCLGVGGLFTYWSGDLERAPAWMRRCGIEWLHLLWRQPHKARRYVLGNPLFIARSLLQALRGGHQ